MLQQTTVAAVKEYYLKFIARWPTVEDLAAAKLDDVLKAWAGLGYYARARNLHACAKAVAAQGGAFPRDLNDLMELPGIGPYTAAAIAAIAFDLPSAAVDGNVERVISRYYALEEPLPASKPQIKELTQALVPQARAGDFAQAMMDLGATICTPKSPSCVDCPLMQDCKGRIAGLATVLPRKLAKKKVPTRFAHVYWIENGKGEVLIRQRPMKGLLAGMTEFPSTEWIEKRQTFKPPLKASWRKAGTIEHTFTHFHLVLEIHVTRYSRAALGCRLVAVGELRNEALPSVMRKVATAIIRKG